MQDQLIAEPTALDQLVSELNHSGKSQYTGMLFPVHTRLQAPLYGLIEALTHHAGTSRNKVVNQLLEVGLEATLAALPEDLAEDMRPTRSFRRWTFSKASRTSRRRLEPWQC